MMQSNMLLVMRSNTFNELNFSEELDVSCVELNALSCSNQTAMKGCFLLESLENNYSINKWVETNGHMGNTYRWLA